MVHITNDELIRLARSCRLRITEQDARTRIVPKLEAVLSYASQLATVENPDRGALYSELAPVVRADMSIPSPADMMMRQAPLQRERYFVVPVVLSAEGNS